MELIELLTQSLDVNQKQAKGGAGLIFQLAKQQLGDGEFSKVANVVPGLNDLLGAAPQEGRNVVGAIGGLVGALGGGGGSVGKLAGLASLAGGFGQLGLKPDMISKFAPIILSFVQSQGGDEVKNILAGILK
ncbi:Protein of unknown function VcgC/VcgE (DUF2780) [Xenococcus sp. PCC 7305]|uniref:DUF2780 domain-containing protein n=1 Tax=Xenococcus sp. PCC 7305 TaxID=102125 RepID=UPI0002AC976D|nr:DUF2780 domain-containing protein [Xenococcus sp. PCC 7305]ELS02344.1 Protein of unknown function VcgC/VcgE (DUF2780) [Xenococcus sp. PCC 7305]